MTNRNRKIIGVVLFVLAVVMFLVMGLWGGTVSSWLIGALLGAMFVLAGLFFYRRGK